MLNQNTYLIPIRHLRQVQRLLLHTRPQRLIRASIVHTQRAVQLPVGVPERVREADALGEELLAQVLDLHAQVLRRVDGGGGRGGDDSEREEVDEAGFDGGEEVLSG